MPTAQRVLSPLTAAEQEAGGGDAGQAERARFGDDGEGAVVVEDGPRGVAGRVDAVAAEVVPEVVLGDRERADERSERALVVPRGGRGRRALGSVAVDGVHPLGDAQPAAVRVE